MCDRAMFPSQTIEIVLPENFLSSTGAAIAARLPFCVAECVSNCGLDFKMFRFVSLGIKSNCRAVLIGINDRSGNISQTNAGFPIYITQTLGSTVTPSNVFVTLVNGDSNFWANLLAQFGNAQLTLCIEYWVDCNSFACADNLQIDGVFVGKVSTENVATESVATEAAVAKA